MNDTRSRSMVLQQFARVEFAEQHDGAADHELLQPPGESESMVERPGDDRGVVRPVAHLDGDVVPPLPGDPLRDLAGLGRAAGASGERQVIDVPFVHVQVVELRRRTGEDRLVVEVAGGLEALRPRRARGRRGCAAGSRRRRRTSGEMSVHDDHRGVAVTDRVLDLPRREPIADRYHRGTQSGDRVDDLHVLRTVGEDHRDLRSLTHTQLRQPVGQPRRTRAHVLPGEPRAAFDDRGLVTEQV